MEIKKGMEIERNGILIRIHFLKNGQVYYQKWPKDIEHQGQFDNLGRMDINEFKDQLEDFRKTVQQDKPVT